MSHNLGGPCRSLDLSVFEVTEEDVAKVPTPVAPVIASSEESKAEVSTQEKERDDSSQSPAVVEEDAGREVEFSPKIDETDKSIGKALASAFWGDDDDAAQPPKLQEDDIYHDLIERTEVVNDEPPAAISLISTVTKKNVAKAKKPKFRSRKAKGK